MIAAGRFGKSWSSTPRVWSPKLSAAFRTLSSMRPKPSRIGSVACWMPSPTR
jgi:hypothetical protein